MIWGQPDRVVWTDSVPHVIDLKTSRAEPELRPEHRRQLLTYAYLVSLQPAGIWPETATILYVGGETHTIRVAPVEALAAVASMKAALSNLNRLQGTALDQARPSPDACRWCSYRAACAPYFESVTSAWGAYDRSVKGRLDEIAVDGRSPRMVVRIDSGDVVTENGTVVVLLTETDRIEELNLVPGSTVSVSGAAATNSPETVIAGWDSVVCVWESGS